MAGRRKKEKISIKFLDFGITKIFFELNTDIEHSKEQEEATFKFATDFKGETTFDEKNLILVVKLEVKINWEGDISPFDVEVAGKGTFKLNRKPDDCERLAWVNCAAIIFPFIRETIADVTRRSGLPPLLLPPINFVKLFEEKSKSKNKLT